jgi:uncharacterized protein YjiS (DUF1127 family)
MVIDSIKGTWTQQNETASSNLAEGIFVGLTERFAEWRASRREQRAAATLTRMSDHALKDIGIDRSEIVGIVRHKAEDRRQGYNSKHANPGG